MATGTLQKRLSHRDHGRELTFDEFMAGDYEEGYRYELIEGRLYVSPYPNLPHAIQERYVHEALLANKARKNSVIKEVFAKARVFVPGPTRVTCPEPDLTVYSESPSADQRWQDLSPLVVVEIVSPDNSYKDFVRNVDLYQRVPSIREYWLFDKCAEDDGPTLRVYHRGTARQKWKIAEYGPRDTYTTALLPGFKLPVCPPK
jgi:Uma2 family endonuclease